MRKKNNIGFIILLSVIILFFPIHFYNQYKDFKKLSRAFLVYEHNKNYNLSMKFENNKIKSIYLNSVLDELSQITFSEITLTKENETLKLSILGDKPYLSSTKKIGLKETTTRFYHGTYLQKDYFLKIFNTETETINEEIAFENYIIYLPYVISYLGKNTIYEENNKFIFNFNNETITANIETNTEGRIKAIYTKNNIAYYSNYTIKNKVYVPTNITINNASFSLKKIKMSITPSTRH
jgi:hypothetical protein